MPASSRNSAITSAARKQQPYYESVSSVSCDHFESVMYLCSTVLTARLPQATRSIRASDSNTIPHGQALAIASLPARPHLVGEVELVEDRASQVRLQAQGEGRVPQPSMASPRTLQMRQVASIWTCQDYPSAPERGIQSTPHPALN
jgi:hypothetical protein